MFISTSAITKIGKDKGAHEYENFSPLKEVDEWFRKNPTSAILNRSNPPLMEIGLHESKRINDANGN